MIAILLSTYNGDKYLREQLDSLFHQTHDYFNLYVRDDGSTDNTINIIKEYQNIYQNIYFFNDRRLLSSQLREQLQNISHKTKQQQQKTQTKNKKLPKPHLPTNHNNENHTAS